jgi:hypothetical protein
MNTVSKILEIVCTVKNAPIAMDYVRQAVSGVHVHVRVRVCAPVRVCIPVLVRVHVRVPVHDCGDLKKWFDAPFVMVSL